MHKHPYSQGVQQHWSTHPGGITNAPTGYSHTHEGNTHPHPFSPGVQQHWGMYPGGRGRGTAGYSHSHKRGGKAMRKRMKQGGRARRTFQNGGPTCPSGQVWSAGAQQCVNIVDINNPGKGIETFGELIDIQNPGRGLQTFRRGGRMKRKRMQMGGRTDCPPGQYRQGGRCVQSTRYRSGGRIKLLKIN